MTYEMFFNIAMNVNITIFGTMCILHVIFFAIHYAQGREWIDDPEILRCDNIIEGTKFLLKVFFTPHKWRSLEDKGIAIIGYLIGGVGIILTLPGLLVIVPVAWLVHRQRTKNQQVMEAAEALGYEQ